MGPITARGFLRPPPVVPRVVPPVAYLIFALFLHRRSFWFNIFHATKKISRQKATNNTQNIKLHTVQRMYGGQRIKEISDFSTFLIDI